MVSVCLVLVFSVSCSPVPESRPDPAVRPHIGRLDRMIRERTGRGKQVTVSISHSGRNTAINVTGIGNSGISTDRDGRNVVMDWDRFMLSDIVRIARKAAGKDPEGLRTAAELAVDAGMLDLGSELLARAYVSAPDSLREIRRIADKMAPLSGSPLADSRSRDLMSVPPSKIRADRPRILLRAEKWRGPALEEIRRRAGADAWKPFVNMLTGKGAGPASLALHYLATGDTGSADRAVNLLQKRIFSKGISLDGDALEEAAAAFDWLADYPGFKGEKREKAVQRIAQAAERLMLRLEVGMHVFHTRMYTWATGLACAGISLMGEHPRAGDYFNFGCIFWMTRLMPAREYQGGAWHNGFGYGERYIVRSTFSFLAVIRSATGTDLWKTIRNEQKSWAQDMFYFILYTTLRDGTHPAFGDCYNRGVRYWDTPLALQYASETGDPYAAEFGAMLIEHYGPRAIQGKSSSIWNRYGLLYVDPERPRKLPDDLPGSRCFGPEGMGYAVMRSGWGDNSTVVFFKCGDYFGNHGHFDQGHFEIFRWKPMVVEGGRYAGFGSDHRLYYYRQSIAHNTILIADPDDPRDIGNQRLFTFQVAGTLKEYLNAEQCETGDIIHFSTGKDFTIVIGDVSRAYEQDKVEQFTRILYYQQGTYLAVFDTVITAKPGMKLTFLLHCSGETKVRGRSIIIENKRSRTVCSPLVPEHTRITRPFPFSVGDRVFSPHGWRPEKPHRYAGRIEISPEGTAGKRVHFLNMFYVGDRKTEQAGARITEKETEFVLSFPDRQVVFPKTGRSAEVVF